MCLRRCCERELRFWLSIREMTEERTTNKLTSGHLLYAVAHRLEFRSGLLVPEAPVEYVTGHSGLQNGYSYELTGSYLADAMWVTRSDYATEFEIKISRADWKADNDKGKWGFMPPWINRFIYVTPVELGIPDFVPEFAGVWHWAPNDRYGWTWGKLTVARAPRRIGQTKVPASVKERWLYNLHCRFWHKRLYVDNRVPRISAAASTLQNG